MQADAKGDLKSPGSAADRAGRQESVLDTRENSEESVTGRIHLSAAELPQLRPDGRVVSLDQLRPPAVAEPGRQLR
jgi:hypothetical protein